MGSLKTLEGIYGTEIRTVIPKIPQNSNKQEKLVSNKEKSAKTLYHITLPIG